MKIGSLSLSLLTLAVLGACTHTAPAAEPPAPAPAVAKPAAVAPPAGPLPGEQVLATQPALPPLRPFDAPVPQLTTLPNGLRIYTVERPGDGIEALQLIVRRGAATDPVKLPGLASLVAAMLEAGSAGRSQTEIASAADAIGADLHVGAGTDSTQVGISAMPTRLQEMVTLLADVSLRPNFDEKEWKLLQGKRTAELIAARAQPQVGAGMAWSAAAYGAHPLGRPAAGTPESVKATTLAEVKGAFKAFSPKETAIFAMGGAKTADVVAALQKAFGGWKAPKGAQLSTAQVMARSTLAPERPRLVLVDYPGKPQAVLRVGQPSVPRSTPDYLALRVINSVLGGSFTSRLNQNLREVHGYSYGAFSAFGFGAGPSPFIAASNVKTEVTGAALREMVGELDRIATQPMSDEEVAKGKALLAFGLVQSLEHATTAANELSQIFLYDLPLDTYQKFVPSLEALTAKDLLAAAQRNLQPGKMTITIAGDVAKVAPQLKAEAPLALPAPQLRDSSGVLVPTKH